MIRGWHGPHVNVVIIVELDGGMLHWFRDPPMMMILLIMLLYTGVDGCFRS